ncbi:alpha/beta hydrolase [Microbacterium oxydans]|uniref:alpha/beta hydrolase n=1 Tax=Microbacterium oxydans TaxID=82380 RepID=UPI0022B0C19E|nr:alpha/beta fold hydrolase [Microbacterium oxydans]MCZ4300076.1 alpha/beta fold hydrolase [Microbacterium oxydans]
MKTMPSCSLSGEARFGRTTAAIILSILAIVVGVALAVVFAVLGLHLSLVAGLIAGAVALFGATWLLTALAHKTWPPSDAQPRPALVRRKSPYVVAGATLVVASVAAGATVLAPIEGDETPLAVPEPSFWNLETGSRIAYWEYEAQGDEPSSTPIIYVHGGPGGFNDEKDFDFIPRLAETGHDVYLYDQPGAGFSPDLELDEYTEERWLADLDAVREETGAEKAILIGQSAGGYIVEAYAANYPDHVEQAILTAPGGFLSSDEITAAEAVEGAELERLDPDFHNRSGDIATMQEKLTPRVLATVALQGLGMTGAASNLTSQDELKRWSATALGSGFGLNFMSTMELNSEFTEHMPDTIQRLESKRTVTCRSSTSKGRSTGHGPCSRRRRSMPSPPSSTAACKRCTPVRSPPPSRSATTDGSSPRPPRSSGIAVADAITDTRRPVGATQRRASRWLLRPCRPCRSSLRRSRWI